MNDLEKIAWTDEFSVGNKRLDEQHFKIVSFINKLIDLPSFNSQAEARRWGELQRALAFGEGNRITFPQATRR